MSPNRTDWNRGGHARVSFPLHPIISQRWAIRVARPRSQLLRPAETTRSSALDEGERGAHAPRSQGGFNEAPTRNRLVCLGCRSSPLSLQIDLDELPVLCDFIMQVGLLRIAVPGNDRLQFLGRLRGAVAHILVRAGVVFEEDSVLGLEGAELRAAVVQREVAVVVREAVAGTFGFVVG